MQVQYCCEATDLQLQHTSTDRLASLQHVADCKELLEGLVLSDTVTDPAHSQVSTDRRRSWSALARFVVCRERVHTCSVQYKGSFYLSKTHRMAQPLLVCWLAVAVGDVHAEGA